MRTAVYRSYDRQGALLYVGIAAHPFARMSQHEHESEWADLASSVRVEWWPTREAALAEEARAIVEERPRFNRHLNQQGNRAHSLVTILGQHRVARALKIVPTAVNNAAMRGTLPTRWYFCVKALADADGIECPIDLFGFLDPIPSSEESEPAGSGN